MNPFQQAQWIWPTDEVKNDTYGEFYAEFTAKKSAVCRISCDGDYTLYLNGVCVGCNQYGDFEHYKIYDEIDLSSYLKNGKNRLACVVWHFGLPLMRYRPGKAGVIFEVSDGKKVLAASGKETRARMSRAYQNEFCHSITPQLGYSFRYNSALEDGWKEWGDEGFAAPFPVDKKCEFYPRPISRFDIEPRAAAIMEDLGEGKKFRIDLGRETVGLFSISCHSPVAQTLTVSWGEHLEVNNAVSRKIGGRDFSLEFGAAQGQNDYTNYMLRLGLRYLEIECESPIELQYAGVLPEIYPVNESPLRPQDAQDRAIYDVCLRTLRLCMMEHYVDCPWREQCLYGFDSRNQMLAGYCGFEGGNTDYAKANLRLLAEDRREDGLLSICSPCGIDFTIPSFSLHFILAFAEHIKQTKDLAFAKQLAPKAESILSFVLAQKKEGILYPFQNKVHWNFYDWSEFSDGYKKELLDRPDIVLNALTVQALDAFEKVCLEADIPFAFGGEAEALRLAARELFYHKEEKLCSMFAESNNFTELSNSMALLSGIAPAEARERIAQALAEGNLVPCSLSMKATKYDAMLSVNFNYKENILAAIRADYGKMLAAGATSVWETDKGWEDFGHAGSLCHGWSGIPVYYYHLFGMVK